MKKLVVVAVVLMMAGTAKAQDVTPTPMVASLIMSWEMQNDACQGGNQQACRFRDAQLLSIKSQGWCLSDDKKWQPAPCVAPVKPSAEVQKLMDQDDDLNDKCRGGSGNDPKTMKACDLRDKIGTKIEKLGWCWGHEGQAAYEKTWEPCKQTAQAKH